MIVQLRSFAVAGSLAALLALTVAVGASGRPGAATERFDSGPYSVMVLTNVASPGNLFVGLVSDVKGNFTCHFMDGGLCAGAGGANVPVTYTTPLDTFSSCSAALAAYHQHTMGEHPAFGGEKIYFDTTPIPSPVPSTPPATSVSYFIDNISNSLGPSWCTGGASAPSPAPTTKALTTNDLRQNTAYRAFFGLDDPPLSYADWLTKSKMRCLSVISTAKNFHSVTNEAEISGEFPNGQHSASLGIGKVSDLKDLLDGNLPPSALVPPTTTAAATNVFVNATKDLTPMLREAIVNSGGGLDPADVLKLALQVTNGSYPLAVLTTLTLLKQVTFDGRAAAADAAKVVGETPHSDTMTAVQNTQYQQAIAPISTQDMVVSKLNNLRQNPLQSGDKMGPWYHAFTILTVGAFSAMVIPNGLAAAVWEHFRKLVGFTDPEYSFNLEKATLDFCMASAADQLSVAGLSR